MHSSPLSVVNFLLSDDKVKKGTCSFKMNEKSQIKFLESDRRVSILSLSDAGSDYEFKKNIKYGKPLAGIIYYLFYNN